MGLLILACTFLYQSKNANMHNEICKFMHTWMPNKMEGSRNCWLCSHPIKCFQQWWIIRCYLLITPTLYSSAVSHKNQSDGWRIGFTAGLTPQSCTFYNYHPLWRWSGESKFESFICFCLLIAFHDHRHWCSQFWRDFARIVFQQHIRRFSYLSRNNTTGWLVIIIALAIILILNSMIFSANHFQRSN